ncbi:MAG: heavy metal translocating P-type ATPase [bacterium]|nr:heavy metal translocating P-type ATPase [bacterium]
MATHIQPISQPRTEPDSKPNWLTQSWLEPRLVVVTALAIAASLIAERLDTSPTLILLLNILSYLAGGIFGAKGALESLFKERKLDVDMLMVLAALGAASINQWREGALLLFLFSLSNVLQDYAIGRSRNAIRSLFKLYPQEAKVKRGTEVGTQVQTLSINEIRVGDVVLIEPGERIPVDGVVRGGRSSVDQSPITGESMPVEKGIGEKVFAGTLNIQGALDVEATQPASNTTLSRIIKLVEEAQDAKAPTERFLDRFEQVYAAFILGAVALFIVVPPLLFSADFEANFYRAMVLMTVASPCALVISVPASFISAIAAGARRGVLFKGGAYLEGLASIKAVAFDKTGTLTQGKPAVTDVVPHGALNTDDFLTLVAAAEQRSEHPLAKAIVNDAARRGRSLPAVEDFEAVAGKGVRALIDRESITVGSPSFMLNQFGTLPDELESVRARLEGEGKTVMLAYRGYNGHGQWLGLIALADQIRPEAVETVRRLQKQGVKVAMLTGDNARVAESIAAQVGIDRIFAELLPEDKVTAIRQLETEVGPAAMVGDGVNDAPALATAHIGIAMGAAGTDVALETADLVLMGDRLELIDTAIDLSKRARRVVWQNIAFALFVIFMLVLGAFVVDLPLPLGVLGHEGSTVIVVLNGLIALLIWPEIQYRRRTKANR